MAYGTHTFGEWPFGDVGPVSLYGESWIAQCVGAENWAYVTPRQSTIVDECRLSIVPPVSETDPAIPPAGASWAGIRIPSVPYDSTFAVTDAVLTLVASGNWTGYAQIEIYGVLQADPPEYSATNPVKSRPRTVSKVVWEAPTMTDGVSYAVSVTAPTIEILAQAGRVAGNAIAYTLVGTAGERHFESTTATLDITGAA